MLGAGCSVLDIGIRMREKKDRTIFESIATAYSVMTMYYFTIYLGLITHYCKKYRSQ